LCLARLLLFLTGTPLCPVYSSLTRPPPGSYLDFDDINAFLEDAARQHPTLASLVDSSVYGTGETYEGRTMPLLKISGNVTLEEDEPAILINGMHHAREVVTPVVVMDVISRLLNGYSTYVCAFSCGAV